MEIVRMQACHVPQIAALERLCFSEPWSEKSLLEETENSAAYFIAAVEAGDVLGYAGMHTVLGESYVDNIAVLPAHRGKGIGRALTASLIGRAQADGGAFITLEVRASNRPAVSLYTSLGFEQAGVRRNFYTAPREDALIFTLRFAAQP